MTPQAPTRGAPWRPETQGWVLAVVLALGAATCLVLAGDPLALAGAPSTGPGTPDAGPHLLGAAAVLALLAVAAAGLRRRSDLLWWIALAAVVVQSVLLAGATSTTGLILVSVGYTYLVLHAAYAFETGRLVAMLVAVVVGSVLGSTASEPGLRLVVWATGVGGVVVAGALLGYVMRLLRWYATVDALTGVLTRTAFDATARSALSSVRRRAAQAVLVLIDLDSFKAVNDTHGHAAGDELLVRTVRAWRQRLRGQDVLGRSGGDEFVLLLPDTDLTGARRLVEVLAEASPIAFSAGLALAGPDDALDVLLRRADAGMYEVKRTRAEG